MTLALVISSLLLAAIAAHEIVRARATHRSRPSLDCVGLRSAFLCADCSGSLVQHRAWCGRGERPAHEHDPREVRKGSSVRRAGSSNEAATTPRNNTKRPERAMENT